MATLTMLKPTTVRSNPTTDLILPDYECHFDGCESELGQRLHGHGEPLMARFWKKVDFNGPLPALDTVARGQARCWLWKGRPNADGYCYLWVESRLVLVHRFVYEHTQGPIPAGFEVDHMCHIRNCLLHLEAVTPKINSTRSADRRTFRKGLNLGPAPHWIAPTPFETELLGKCA